MEWIICVIVFVLFFEFYVYVDQIDDIGFCQQVINEYVWDLFSYMFFLYMLFFRLLQCWLCLFIFVVDLCKCWGFVFLLSGCSMNDFVYMLMYK